MQYIIFKHLFHYLYILTYVFASVPTPDGYSEDVLYFSENFKVWQQVYDEGIYSLVHLNFFFNF
jgi:hypothetical protein